MAQTTYPSPEEAMRRERLRLDTQIVANENLILYRELDYCSRLDYIDGMVISDTSSLIFYNDYVELAVRDICLQAHVNSAISTSSMGGIPIYRDKETYFKVSKECREKLKCHKSKKGKRCGRKTKP